MRMPFLFSRRGRVADALIPGPVLTGVIYVLFPEVAALSYDVFKRPEGKWASAPHMLAMTPAITAAMGTAITQTMACSLWSVALTIAGAILIVRCMRSPIVPAISAAFLPLVFGITSWWYPVLIAAVMAALALISVIYSRFLMPKDGADAGANHVAPPPSIGMWPSFGIFTVFLLLAYGLATLTGLRMILFPPLVVIAFEIFVLANILSPARRHLALPVVCTIAAGAGLAALLMFGAGTLSVVVSLLVGMVTLRVLRLHFPPALTVGLLPQIMTHPDWRFVLAVALGATTLTAVIFLVRPFFLQRHASLTTS